MSAASRTQAPGLELDLAPTHQPHLLDLAVRINAAHREARAYAAQAVERALEAGDLLLSVKATLAHGQWLPWLAEHCPDISARTAQGYMRIARDLPAEMRTGAYLSLNGAKRLLAVPKDGGDVSENITDTLDPGATLRHWLDTAPLCDGDFPKAVFLLDADGWTIEQITEALAANAARFSYHFPPQAGEVAAWLNPRLTERSTCCSRHVERDPGAAYPKGADAEDLYRLAARYWLGLFQRTHTESAAWQARQLGREDLAASLKGALRVIDRSMVAKLPAPRTLLEQAAHTAAFVDVFHARSDTAPEDGWQLPIGMWICLCLRIATDEAGSLWEAARALFAKPVNPEAVEAMKLFRAAVVYLHVTGAVLGNMSAEQGA